MLSRLAPKVKSSMNVKKKKEVICVFPEKLLVHMYMKRIWILFRTITQDLCLTVTVLANTCAVDYKDNYTSPSTHSFFIFHIYCDRRF